MTVYGSIYKDLLSFLLYTTALLLSCTIFLFPQLFHQPESQSAHGSFYRAGDLHCPKTCTAGIIKFNTGLQVKKKSLIFFILIGFDLFLMFVSAAFIIQQMTNKMKLVVKSETLMLTICATNLH